MYVHVYVYVCSALDKLSILGRRNPASVVVVTWSI